MINDELKKNLKKFLDKAFYLPNRHQASKLWSEIAPNITEPYRTRISMEFIETECDHGRKQSCDALADEVNKFIKTL